MMRLDCKVFYRSGLQEVETQRWKLRRSEGIEKHRRIPLIACCFLRANQRVANADDAFLGRAEA